MPATRSFAKDLAVSRNTIIAASVSWLSKYFEATVVACDLPTRYNVHVRRGWAPSAALSLPTFRRAGRGQPRVDARDGPVPSPRGDRCRHRHRVLRRFLVVWLHDIRPTNPAPLLAGLLVLAAVALLASWLAARRAVWRDPAAALRAAARGEPTTTEVPALFERGYAGPSVTKGSSQSPPNVAFGDTLHRSNLMANLPRSSRSLMQRLGCLR